MPKHGSFTPAQQRRLRKAPNPRPSLRMESLEPRVVMDGSGFVNTDPTEDPGSIVGVAEVEAVNDFLSVRTGTQIVRISPLANDPHPDGAGELTITSVSNTRVGATVTVSEDGRHLLYDAPAGGLNTWDSFYYIVETEDGRQGKADVRLSVFNASARSLPIAFQVLEDSGEAELPLIERLGLLEEGFRITSVTAPWRSGEVSIGEGGQSLLYRPAPGVSGVDGFEVTVRSDSGETRFVRVSVSVDKPWQIRADDPIEVADGGEPLLLDPLANDLQLGATTLTPRIDQVTAPDYAGEVSIVDDGQRIRFEPADGFIGDINVGYSVRYGEADHQVARGSVGVSVLPGVTAVENWFAATPDAEAGQELDVLANDLVGWRLYSDFLEDGTQRFFDRVPPGAADLRIVAVGEGSDGGEIAIDEAGKRVLYRPAAGFRGEETFTYTAELPGGARQSATVTVYVADEDPGASGVATFATEGELRQYLIDRAIERHGSRFGRTYTSFYHHTVASVDTATLRVGASGSNSGTPGYSETNTQVDGVDEADIVETDGQYVYTLRGKELVIVDLDDPENPVVVSVTSFEQGFDKMYLQGERLTLLRSGNRWHGGAEVVVLDLGDRTEPVPVERTEIDGAIVDSRAIGDRVHLVVQSRIELPPLEHVAIADAGAGGQEAVTIHDPRRLRFETLDEYLGRVREELIETALPTFRAYDSADTLVDSGLLTQPTDVHKPILGEDLAITFVTLDAGDEAAGPVAEATTLIADDATDVYVSAESAYLFSYDRWTDATTIHKLSLQKDGSAPLVASTTVRGQLLNQFAADEHDGLLRIAVTQLESPTSSRWTGRIFNNVLVLEQQGTELVVVGEVTNLAPTETIHAVRFQGDRAFVVTFRLIDPLFAIDLSDPTNPTVEGELKIPGFSNYLHPVGDGYLIGIGRDADEITGSVGPIQVTLFDVRDLSNPVVADQVTFDGSRWASTVARFDHLAVSFFESDAGGTLAIPVTWSEPARVTDFFSSGTARRSAIFTFDVSTEGDASITESGRVVHDEVIDVYRKPGRLDGSANDALITSRWRPPSEPLEPARRSLRIGESLVTISDQLIKVHELEDVAVQLGEVFIGQVAADDRFVIQEDSGANTLAVLENDQPGEDGVPGSVVAVSQPASGGVAEVAADGRSILFTPADDFHGSLSFTYTVEDPIRGPVEAGVSVTVNNVLDAPIAVDDQFAVRANNSAIILDVLGNDEDPDRQQHGWWGLNWGRITIAQPVLTTSFEVTDLRLTGDAISVWPGRVWPIVGSALEVTAVGPADRGGTVELSPSGRITYQPLPGFEGIDTFTYTVMNASGLMDTATVTVVVGEPPPSPPSLVPTPPPLLPPPAQLPETVSGPPRPAWVSGDRAENLLLASQTAPAVDQALLAGPPSPLAWAEVQTEEVVGPLRRWELEAAFEALGGSD
ncbi:MAG: beta-propeller domain-containing protein [Planctomycetota bacterium]